jgi:enoyl-CoA hydratase/carnithine racemase
MSTEYATILYDESAAPVARITLNRPEKRNPIGPLTNGELVDALNRAQTSDAVRVVILTGAGKVFCGGGDLAQMSGQADPEQGRARPATLIELFTTMHGLGKPIVAMVNGHALGGGLGLICACDLAVVSAEAELGTTEIHVGLWPMMISAEIVRSIGRKRALELMMTGRRLKAEEAERMGLINRVVAADRLEAETVTLARELAAKSPTAMRLGLKAFYETQDLAYRPALEHLLGQLATVLASDDAAEGIAAFFEKRDPAWKGR